MDQPEDEAVRPPRKPRRPICPDCMGHGTTDRPRWFVARSEGLQGTLAVPGRCASCRGTGKAGA